MVLILISLPRCQTHVSGKAPPPCKPSEGGKNILSELLVLVMTGNIPVPKFPGHAFTKPLRVTLINRMVPVA
jgi:hypothetical protein